MNINLSPDLQAFVDRLVQHGRFASADEAITEGVQLLASREQLIHEVGLGIEQANRGDLIDHNTVFGNLRLKAAAPRESNAGE